MHIFAALRDSCGEIGKRLPRPFHPLNNLYVNILHRLSVLIQRAHSLDEVLDGVVETIAEELKSDVCSIYLLDPNDHRLHLTATYGLQKESKERVVLDLGEGLTGIVVQEMRCLAVEDASSHPGYRYFPETKEEQYSSYLGVPMALRNRPVGAIVVQTRLQRTYNETESQTLTAISTQLVGIVENARLINALDRGHEGLSYLREVRSWHLGESGLLSSPDKDKELVLRGTAASPGMAIGEAVLRGSLDTTGEAFNRPLLKPEEEKALVTQAFEETHKEIARIQYEVRRETDEEHALIFSSHLLLLNDHVLRQQIETAVEQSRPAHVAVFEALGRYCSQLEQVPDPYIQERVEDIMDVRSRLLSHLTDSKSHSSSVSDKIVVAQGISPSLVVELKAEGARGIITTRGGPTSHGALLARSMGIPAVTGVRYALAGITSGSQVFVDGSEGEVIHNPATSTLKQLEEKMQLLIAQTSTDLKFRALPGRTLDGRKVSLHANISIAADLAKATKNGAEGVGLFRTEFPFLIREDFPTQAEQARVYRKVYDYFPEGPARFRLLDLGGDKLLPGNAMRADRNPFRGYRSLRLLLDHPDVLVDQVQAFSHAAGTRPLSILIPMVSSLTELRRALDLMRNALDRVRPSGAPIAKIGAMIEVPGAVEIVDLIAKEVDFLSIGSNDLIQYFLAVDRENENAASVDDPYHPAVLRAIARIVRAGHDQGRDVTVCGEIASLRPLTLALTAMGIDSLSLAPGVIPGIKRLLASSTVKPLERDLDAILQVGEASELRKELENYLPTDVLSAPTDRGLAG